jgi:hypothetical protein
MIEFSLKGFLSDSQMQRMNDNRVLYNYNIDKRVVEETRECICRKMTDYEREMYEVK